MHTAFKKKEKRKGLSLFHIVAIMVLVAFVLSFITPEKKFRVEMTITEWGKGDKWISIAKNALSKSDLPAKDVSMILDSLQTFQNELYKQLNPQLKVEDSLSKIVPKKN